MTNRSFRRKLPFLAAFLLLSVFSIVLVIFSLRFFSWGPVRGQFNDWVVTLFPGARKVEPEDAPRAGGSKDAASLAVINGALSPGTASTSMPSRDDHSPARPSLVLRERVFHPQDNEAAPSTAEGELMIPALHIDEPLTPVRVEQGTWNVSDLGNRVGWLETTGAYPGDKQSMVVIGHVTLPYPPGGIGPFYFLEKLKQGDEIVYRTPNRVYLYQVEGPHYVSPDAIANLYRPDGNKLILVTCTGWDAITGQYVQRLLVEANLVRTEESSSNLRRVPGELLAGIPK